ncbi:MAG: hypothetical protein IJ849_09570 [Selenomonadaceae bacterium]|nr:hypothetical protein [Selenomonadaceae bacterium]
MTNLEAIKSLDAWDMAEKLVEWTGCECDNCPAEDECDVRFTDEVHAENCEIALKIWLEAPYKPLMLPKTSELFDLTMRKAYENAINRNIR